MTRLGYYQDHETVLVRPGDISSARAVLSDTPKPKIGGGMEAGRIVVKLNNDHVRVALLTPQGRRWYGPLFEGTFENHEGRATVLRGRFRCTYPEIVNGGVLQLGVLICAAEFLLTGSYRSLGLNVLVAALAAVAVILAVGFLPRLTWKTRKWKRVAVTAYLKACGFAAPALPADECRRMS
jgi:hypothetical protein